MGMLSCVLVMVLCLWVSGSTVLGDSRREVPLLRMPPNREGTGCYFIVMKDKTSEAEMQQLMATISRYAEDSRVYSVVKKVAKAFTVKLSPFALQLVRQMSAVDYIEEEGFAVGTQEVPEWHLDRLDQATPTLDGAYWPIGDGAGVDVYIMDSGIHYEHEEFENRAKFSGLDPTDDYNENFFPDLELTRQNGRDCHGHGTHVSSLCGGKTYGSAKRVSLYSVRVLGCNNAGPWSVVLEGLEHAVSMAEKSSRPTVLSMSFSGDRYQVVNDAILNVLQRGVQCVMAAGNGQEDACSRSPASVGESITVGGTRQGDGLYLLGSGTNFGSCVDIFAPAERVLAADWSCVNCSRYLSGTSMSTPLVSGLAAILLSKEPRLSPAELKGKLIEASIKDAIDFDGMPEYHKPNTANRLASIQGKCGESRSAFGTSTMSSPNFPLSYPPNLDCRWEVGGEAGVHIKLHIDFLHLEEHYDTLRVYDGCCGDPTRLHREFTGNLKNVDYSFNSTGNLACIQLLTDGTLSESGFNGTYTKFYAGTDLIVPNPTIVPPASLTEGNTDVEVTLLMSPRQARDHIKTLMGSGYKLTWISSYRLGPSMNPYFDFVASNSSRVDTVSFVEISYEKLDSSIREMRDRGYSVKVLIDRIRGKNPSSPSYSVIFEPRNAIFETEVFLRDSFKVYETRLANNTRAGYRISSHSFCSIRGNVEATSVYTRDRRIAYNIPIPKYPALVVKNNMTFFDFTSATLTLAGEGFYPYSVEVYLQGDRTDSSFSAIFEERNENSQGNWFRWSLNTTAARDLIELQTGRSWEVYLTVGYTYLSKSEHFVEFKRKGL